MQAGSNLPRGMMLKSTASLSLYDPTSSSPETLLWLNNTPYQRWISPSPSTPSPATGQEFQRRLVPYSAGHVLKIHQDGTTFKLEPRRRTKPSRSQSHRRHRHPFLRLHQPLPPLLAPSSPHLRHGRHRPLQGQRSHRHRRRLLSHRLRSSLKSRRSRRTARRTPPPHPLPQPPHRSTPQPTPAPAFANTGLGPGWRSLLSSDAPQPLPSPPYDLRTYL